MKNKIVTKFKQLTQYWNQDNVFVSNGDKDLSKPQVLFKTRDKQEYLTKKLEKQQTNWLRGQWQKVKTHIQQKALVYETQRYPSYIDYDLMEQYPIIGAALDIIAEESTTVNAEGMVLNIYSESKRVQAELDELFYNRLNVHTNLVMWIRNMCKYGDNFVYLQMDDELGIIGARQLANIEVERLDGNATNYMRSVLQQDDDEVLFRWKSVEMVEFKYWQVAHFRLLMDDRKLPYGVSVLEKGRRIWKNILLVEDAMRTIRLLRAIDRRAYYINVGNIDSNDVKAYIEDIASRFKRKRHVDPRTGQEDLKFNVIGYDQDYFIPIRDKDDGTRIETIQGSSNLDQIGDIEYDLAQLFAALGVPKPFLQYEDTAGEGKNLALQDIRFARKINRIQQAALQELNKIAITHLILVGLEDEVHNFELSLNNPSTQADLMRTEHLAQQISTFKDAVSDANGHGIAAMSVTMAMKKILGFTDDEIRLNLEQQYIERAAGAELEKAPEVISNTTIFDNVTNLYGDEVVGIEGAGEEGEEGEEGGDAGGFGGGGGGFGGDLAGDEDLGLDVEGGDEGDIGGDEGLEGDADIGGDEAGDVGEDLGESFSNHQTDDLIVEDSLKRITDLLMKMDNI